jgi:hypothetical protein
VGLFSSPIITKFFSNKIESSRPEWGDYLLEIADIFSTFDGEEVDRELLESRFSPISGRSLYAPRDVSNFRDEFGAYGPYLGLYHFELENNKWKIYLSNAAKHFLCSVEPDVESFCRTQMSLFQYPNGAGAVQHYNGSVSMRSKVKESTIREIKNQIRINPFRLICKITQVFFEEDKMPLNNIIIPYEILFLLMNDDRINTLFSPDNAVIHSTITGYKTQNLPQWAIEKIGLTNFKRNFHIFDRTGLFKHTKNGLVVADGNLEKIYSYITVIANMNHDFHGYDLCYNSEDTEHNIDTVVSGLSWGKYFDAFSMPIQILKSLSDSVLDEQGILINEVPLDSIEIGWQIFPELQNFQSNQIRAFSSTGKTTDPFETIILREKANREHERILNRTASLIRYKNYSVFENVFIDLLASINNQDFIFEVKSNNTRNALSQIRKAIAQLYEYRYRSKRLNAVLCIILQQQPTQDWIIDYLVNDRNIMICWLVDDVRIECPPQCYDTLVPTGIV